MKVTVKMTAYESIEFDYHEYTMKVGKDTYIRKEKGWEFGYEWHVKKGRKLYPIVNDDKIKELDKLFWENRKWNKRLNLKHSSAGCLYC